MNPWDLSSRISRRKFLQYLAFTGVAASGGAGLFYAAAIEPYQVEIVQIRFALPGLKDSLRGLRAVQISDLHMGRYFSREQLEYVISLAMAQNPDMLLITGDSITAKADTKRALADLEAAFSGVAEKVPVFAVMGNHDVRDQPLLLRALYARLGIQLLVNEILPFSRSGGVLYIAGLDSAASGEPDLPGVAYATPADGPTLLLAHEPDLAAQAAATGKFALQLSGHTHGGQVNFPLIGPLILPVLGRLYLAGLYQVGGMALYVNRGIGMTALPVRLNAAPEITVLTFVPG